MRIFVDAMGGDLAPQAPVEGTVEALRRNPELTVTLAGIVPEIEKYLAGADDVLSRITLLDAPEVITNHESPVMGVRKKTKSATVLGMLAVRDKEADGFVSAGSTGAVLAGGMFRLGRIPGVERPALAPLLPNGKGSVVLLQFGVMGDAYMRGVMGIEKPRVGIINIGAEDEKGNALVKDAFPMMTEAPYHFVGSVEARDLFSDIADVCVADGFAGNLVLKTMEGVAMFMLKTMKQELMADTRSKIGAALAKPALRRLKHTLDYTEVGGAPLLGVQGAVVKAHGSSNAHAFSCAIDQAIKMVNGHVVEIIEKGVAKMNSQDAQ